MTQRRSDRQKQERRPGATSNSIRAKSRLLPLTLVLGEFLPTFQFFKKKEKFLYHQRAYPNGEHAHIYAPLSILRAAKTVFKSNFSAVLAVPPHSPSCCSLYSVPAVLQSKASCVSVCVCVIKPCISL